MAKRRRLERARDRRPTLLPEVFRNVTITPFTGLLDQVRGLSTHCGGPVWPDWDAQHLARHKRGGNPIDDPPEPAAKPASPVAEPAVWLGPATNHFGHQVADFSTRILPAVRGLPEHLFLIGTKPSKSVPNPFVFAILAWFGVPKDRIRVVDAPVIAADLAVFDQQEELHWVGPSAAYLDLLDDHTQARLAAMPPNAERDWVYVSRSRLATRIAGEAAVDEAFQRAGALVMHPERMSLVDQLRVYAGARNIVFAEGSAIHGCQLLGRQLGDVFVLNRRGGFRIAHHTIAPRARSLAYIDCVNALVTGSNRGGGPSMTNALSVSDTGALASRLVEIGVRIDVDAFTRHHQTQIPQDVRDWIRSIDGRPASRNAGFWEAVQASVDAAGIALDVARERPGALRRALMGWRRRLDQR